MIINFRVKNWMSFREETNFSMLATKERQHDERVPAIKKYQTRILPIAAIYGGNASGKTNFLKALNFAKCLIVKGTQPESLIPVETFKLDPQLCNQPAHFSFELLINNLIYDFSFSVTKESVQEEKLIEITGSNERILYHRKKGGIRFEPTLSKRDESLNYVFKGTRENQLFLTNSVSQKVETFRAVYDWFDKLTFFSDLSKLSEVVTNKIYLIDVSNNNLHTLLTRQLLEFYLSNCSKDTRSQVLFTTHDVQLMDQNIFRRDEIWVAERDSFGNSTLIPFSAYKDICYDKDIRKSYLQGRLGGIPNLKLNNN